MIWENKRILVMEGEIWFERMNFDQFGRRLEHRHFWFLTYRPYNTIWTIWFYLFLICFKKNNNNNKRKLGYSVLCLTYARLSHEGAWHWQGANIHNQPSLFVKQTIACPLPSGLALARSSKPLKFPILTWWKILKFNETISGKIDGMIHAFFLFLFLFLLIIWKVLRIRWWNGLVSLPETNWSWCLVLGDWVSKFYQLLRSIESVEYRSLMTWPRPWPRLGLRTYVYTFLFFFFFFLKPSTRFKKFYNAF